MPLAPGHHLGPYEILAQLGEGGMGEVYKARDTRLNREVALKTSKLEFSERFEREARAVAALNHPNICQLYDVGPNYLVMELIDGRELKGPVEPSQAIEYSKQILDALDVAHRKGITHRDLKPANILVTKQGIKLLDFGLAKQDSVIKQTDATLTMGLTSDGQILGTLQYMSPEQLQAKPADARSDIFAFGCILHELLTGTKAFQATTAAETIAAILTTQPPQVPQESLNRVIKKCLAKDPDDRFQSARDLKYNLTLEPTQPKPTRRPYWIAAATLIIGVALGYALRPQSPAKQTSPIRFQILPPEGGRFTRANIPAISPDGRTIAYAATASGKSGIWLQSLDSNVPRYLPGTQGARGIIWSPDSRSLAYSTSSTYFRLDLTGGPPSQLVNRAVFSSAWAPDGRIYYAGRGPGVRSILATGGDEQTFTRLDPARSETNHRNISLLPGNHLLFLAESEKNEYSGIYAAPLADPGRRTLILPGATNAYYAAGHFLWTKGVSLIAQPFDPNTLRLSGQPHTLSDVADRSSANPDLLAFAKGAASGSRNQLAWFSRDGASLGVLPIDVNSVGGLRLSPDGNRVAVAGGDIEIHGTQVTASARSIFHPNRGGNPVWSPDGSRILYMGVTPQSLYVKPVSSAGAPLRLFNTSDPQWSNDWSRDGRAILYSEISPETQRDV
jgi:serine/threonine protein kinase